MTTQDQHDTPPRTETWKKAAGLMDPTPDVIERARVNTEAHEAEQSGGDDPPLDTKDIKRKPGSVKRVAQSKKPKPAPAAPPPLRKLTAKDRVKLRALADAGAITHKWGEPWTVTPELLKMLDDKPE